MARELKRILCGTDFTPHCEAAIDYALHLATLAGGTLVLTHLVHVPSGDLYTGKEKVRTFDEAVRRARQMLEELHRTRLGGAANTELVVEVGAPAEMMIQMARDRRIDLIVTASRGRSEIVDLLLGSTAEKLMRHAPCPVLVVRHGVA